jgi:replicative DNA helicase
MALSSVDETYFANKFTRVAFRRLTKMTEAGGSVPTWTELLDDPKLNEEIRQKLRKSDIEKIGTTTILNRQIRSLNKYRQLRGLFQMSEDVVTNLNKKSVDPETLLTEIAESVVKLRQSRDVDHTVINFGVGNNSTALAKSLLEDAGASFIPSGFNTFDSKNGGFGWGNLVVIGGTTGGGKSTLAAQLGINWSDMGEDVTMVPLEMTEREMTARLMANASGLDVRKILFNKLSDGEKDIYWKAFKRFVKSKKRSEGTLRLFKPTHDMSIEEILASVYPLGSRIIIIDYISLLKGVDGDDAWQKLGAVARYCKIWAESNNAIVVLLCQISAEGAIRYARSIAEHANYCWTFVANQQTQEQEIINIEQFKARNGERFPFTLKATMSNMRVRDLEIEERDKLNVNATVDRPGPGKKAKGLDKTNSGAGTAKVGPPGQYLKDLSDDEED